MADMTALLNLAGTMANALAQNLFNRQIQHLSAGLMRQGTELQDALRLAGRARATLDRQIFHLQTLYEFTAELSPLVATDKLLEAFLLMVMGTFGASRGVRSALRPAEPGGPVCQPGNSGTPAVDP